MLREMGQLFDRYTERRPLLLVTEDLHWSDRATIQLIDYVARRRGSARLMWLASYRLAEVVALDHPLNPLRHELRLHGLCEEIVLDPFSETEVGDYVAQRLPAMAGDEAFARTLHGRTDGVPLFVASLLGDAMNRAQDADDMSAPTPAPEVQLAVPENLAALIEHYMARLGDEQRQLLSAAAVSGVEFRVSTVALTLEREVDSVDQTCEELARMQLWLKRTEQGADAEPSYAFRHALFRQVLYERTPGAVRVHLHRKVGAALARERETGVPVTPAELAMHFERGREPMRALRYYAEAAEAAVLNLSPGECMNLTESALDLCHRRTRAASAMGSRSTWPSCAVWRRSTCSVLAARPKVHSNAPTRCLPIYRNIRGVVCCCSTSGSCCAFARSYAEALALADRAEALAAATNDPVLRLAA